MAEKKTIKVNLYDYYDKVELATQRIALIEKAFCFKKPMGVNEAFDFIMKLGDGDDGEFKLKDFDGFAFYSSGRIRVQFEWDDEEKIEVNIFYEIG